MGSRTTTRILLSGGLLVVLAAFQNCGKTSFSSLGGNSSYNNKASGEIVAMDLDQDDATDTSGGGSTTDSGGGTTGTVDSGNSTGGATDAGSGSSGDIKNNGSDKKNDNAAGSDVAATDTPAPEGPEAGQDDGNAELIACILVEHGKSLKAGVLESDITGFHAVSRSACMTRYACLTLVAAKMPVEGAYRRGYCKGNPNVMHLTNAQVVDLLK